MEINLTKALFRFKKRLLKIIMRTFIFLLCISTFGFTPENVLSQNEKININADITVTVDEVFDIIKEQTEYRFIYKSGMFDNFPKVSLERGVIRVNALLQKSLTTNTLNFSFGDNGTIVITEKSEPLQEITVSGRVKDVNGQPIPGLTVYVTDREPTMDRVQSDFIIRGTATDFDGKFSLKAEVGYYLMVAGIGYEHQSLKITEQTVYDFTMKERVSALDEVLVVGYGTVKKRNLTGSVGSVNSEEIQQVDAQTIDQALVGKIPGVYVTAQNGGPGSGALVNIRGMSALTGDNQPLYVVDGVPIVVRPIFSDGSIEQNQLVDAQPNPLLTINPNDIERVDVLKDASAAAIYGSRAANGVIIVTTKRGKRNQAARFNFSYSGTIQNPINTMDVLNAEEYKEFHTEQAQITLDNTTFPEFFWPFVYPNQLAIINNPDSFFGSGDTDWQKEVINDNALWNRYNFSASGGNEKMNYLISSNVTDQEGVLLGTDFKSYSFNAALDTDVTNRLKIGINVNYNHSINKRSGLTNLTYAALFRPDLNRFDENGNPTSDPAITFGETRNPAEGLGKIRDKTIARGFSGNIYGEYKLVEGLKFRSELSIISRTSDQNRFVPNWSDYRFTSDIGRYGLQADDHLKHVSNTSGINTTFTNTLNYSKTFNDDHTINAVAGLSWDRARIVIKGQRYAGFPDPFILTDINSAREQYVKTSTINKNALNSVFGRINYNYKDRYLVTLTGRRDGSIKFGPNNRYGFFPSAAAAWNIHNESFLENNELISQLKLRASYGITGNDNLAAFSFQPLYTTFNNPFSGTSVYDGINGIAVTGVPNPSIQWEETQQLDIGLEFGLFNGKLNGEVVYFEKNTSDIILLVPVAGQNGAATYTNNTADVSNNGWELTLGGDIVRSNDFRWNSSFNISTNKNVIEALNGGTLFGRGGFLFEGMSPGVIRGFEVVSIAQTQAEIDALNTAAGGLYYPDLQTPGDYIFRDMNGDDVVNDDDIVDLGNINPDFFGGWNNTLSYKNFDFTFNFQFANGNKKIFGPIAGNGGLDLARPNENKERFVLDTWTPNNPDAPYARFGSRTHGTPFSGHNDRSTIDASYFRLRSASVSYNIPKDLLKGIGLNSARLTISGNNLFTITDYPGLDPEGVNQQRAGFLFDRQFDSNTAYPITRNFTIAVNLSF
ncbi:SusC/RagA family TonB-linked outer membrane protein [Seonamhaeicola maritimus]|uniref:SusC/RagA family TonB-linked outer membrane protein n=1 Tax=Seonamhaeicola maritimus TaxID=2591822 RepID=UPI00249494F9|nr:TonB-dependent receptor [Seonamhaeicola maritimus]